MIAEGRREMGEPSPGPLTKGPWLAARARQGRRQVVRVRKISVRDRPAWRAYAAAAARRPARGGHLGDHGSTSMVHMGAPASQVHMWGRRCRCVLGEVHAVGLGLRDGRRPAVGRGPCNPCSKGDCSLSNCVLRSGTSHSAGAAGVGRGAAYLQSTGFSTPCWGTGAGLASRCLLEVDASFVKRELALLWPTAESLGF